MPLKTAVLVKIISIAIFSVISLIFSYLSFKICRKIDYLNIKKSQKNDNELAELNEDETGRYICGKIWVIAIPALAQIAALCIANLLLFIPKIRYSKYSILIKTLTVALSILIIGNIPMLLSSPYFIWKIKRALDE
jgi:hypothetical protein